jgi:hypothetical protein
MNGHEDNKPGIDPAQPLANQVASTSAEVRESFAQPDDLHNLFDVPLNLDDEDPLAAMRDDPNYAALIKELEYIAAQARLLFSPAEEAPSDKVWEGIQKELGTLPAEDKLKEED